MKIVVFTCNRYADIAPAWLYLWRTKWPDCDYEPLFVTNGKTLGVDAPVYYLNGRDDLHFGWRLRQFVKRHYSEEHLLLTMADYLIKSVDDDTIRRAHELCALDAVRHVRLRPMPKPPHPYPVDGFGCVEKRARYSLSLQPGIWETQVIYDLCRDDENPWQTEVVGSQRVQYVAGDFLSTTEHVLPHINYYRKGTPQGLKWVRANVTEEFWPEALRK